MPKLGRAIWVSLAMGMLGIPVLFLAIIALILGMPHFADRVFVAGLCWGALWATAACIFFVVEILFDG